MWFRAVRGLGVLCSAAVLAGQDPAAIRPDPVLGDALERWAAAFDGGEFELDGDFRKELDVYGALVDAGGLLLRYRGSAMTFSHHQMLERMVEAAEADRSVAAARGLLEVAGVGIERSPFASDSQAVRDLAITTLVRMMAADFAIDDAVIAAAATADQEDDWWPSVAARVAALRLVGIGDDHDRRDALLRGVVDGDPRIRLAAAEAIGHRANIDALDGLVDALAIETHPVAAQAMVQAAGRILDLHSSELTAGERARVTEAAVGRLGSIGWRTDVDVVDLAGRHPTASVIPRLIDQLDPKSARALRPRDREFAPVLRERAWQALRRATGALLPIDDPKAWREFWDREGMRVELVSRAPTAQAGRTTTGGFFGIEVKGRETAFVLDASRSMEKRVDAAGRGPSRFDIAVRQLLEVAQDMPRRWQFRVYTFADRPMAWSERGARADERTMRALTAFLAAQRPRGRSDLVAALRMALAVDELRFGVELRGQVDELFVLSDGMPGDADGPADPDALLAWVREANRYQKVRIHTVMAGEGSGADFLRRLAEENGGEFVQR